MSDANESTNHELSSPEARLACVARFAGNCHRAADGRHALSFAVLIFLHFARLSTA